MSAKRAPKTQAPRPLDLAEDLARNGHVWPAVEAVHAALAVEPDDPKALTLLAELMLAGDFYDEAIAAAGRAIEADPACAPAYLALGLAYDRHGGMWDQSILVWQELAEVVPDLVTAHVQFGEALAASGFDEEAIDAWRRALELDRSDARAMYNLAVAALKREGVATALPGFRKAGDLDPSQDELFFRLAGIEDDGEPAPDPAEVGEDRTERLFAAGALAFEEDMIAAAEIVRLLLEEDPDDAEALAIAAYCYLKQEAVNEAIACALRSLAVNSKLQTAICVLGIAFGKRPGLNRHASRVFQALAKVADHEALPHVMLAETLLGLQRYAQAKASFRTAVEIDPSCVRARFGLAAVLLTEGRHSEAQWQVRRAAYYDTKRQRLFWELWDSYSGGGA